MALFGKKTSDAETQFKRDPRKARRFFEHAEAMAEARNYDYAIDCYINGLRHEPDNMAKQEALREVALRRKVARGKPAGLKDRFTGAGKTPIDRLLHAEMLWSKDPLNIDLMLKVMAYALEADQAEPELHLGELGYWVGQMVMEFAQSGKKPNIKHFIHVRDLFRRLAAYAKAVEACKLALQMDEDNVQLLQDLKDLEAERTMQEGGYAEAGEEGGFRKSVRDMGKQVVLDEESSIVKSEDMVEDMIRRYRADYEKKPEDLDLLKKYVDALLKKEDPTTEDQAIHVLSQAFERTHQYRFRAQIGDIKIRQSHRQLRQLKADIDANPQDEQLKKEYQELRGQVLHMELAEFEDRVKNYPTDMRMRFEYGRRLFAVGRQDEAITSFQMAKADPRHRAQAYEYLGRCYLTAGWFQEAVDSLEEGIKAHPLPDDRLGLELRYLKMDALERLARRDKSLDLAREAQKMASQILQTNINFRDIRDRINNLRTLTDQLQAASGA